MSADFLIITPVINANGLIAQTINSILSQEGLGENYTVKYIIADAGTTEGKKNTYVENLLANIGDLKGLEVVHLKYKDKSMYDGIANAIESVKDESFDYFAYINSGDYYSPYCLETVLQSLRRDKKKWVTGCVGSYNSKGQLYKLIEPIAYPSSLIMSGMCGKVIPYIQQESTFFEFKLLKSISLSEFRGFRYAGDYFLWKSFAELGFSLTVLPVWLGGFREHEGQLSSVFKKDYNKEVESIINKKTLSGYLKSFAILALTLLHPRVRCQKIIEIIRAWK